MKEKPYNPQCVEIIQLKEKCGIYQIRNIVNNHIYVGSSKNLFLRYKSHFGDLKRNKHENPYLQYAYNKHGKDSFVFEILEYCEQENRFKNEQYWIDKFYGQGCYNINKDAINPPNARGRKRIFTEQQRKKLSLSQKKRFEENPELRKQMSLARIGKRMGAEHVNSKSVVCLETAKEYAAVSEAKRETGCAGVSACCRHLIHETNGLHFLYKEEYEKLTKDEINEIIFTDNTCKQVVCLETGKIYKKLIDVQADMNTDRTCIRKCCDGQMAETKGYHYVWYKDYKNLTERDIKNILKRRHTNVIRCKCIETGQIFSSINKAAQVLQLQARQIKASCEQQKAYTRGYHFEYVQ